MNGYKIFLLLLVMLPLLGWLTVRIFQVDDTNMTDVAEIQNPEVTNVADQNIRNETSEIASTAGDTIIQSTDSTSASESTIETDQNADSIESGSEDGGEDEVLKITDPIITKDANGELRLPSPEESSGAFIEYFRTEDTIFYCHSRLYTETGCNLYVGSIGGKKLRDLNISLDHGTREKQIMPSHDGGVLVIVFENHISVLDTKTLLLRTLSEVDDNKVFGTYTDFPMFLPYVSWVSNLEVEAWVFKGEVREPEVGEPKPIPLEIKRIKVL